MFALALALIASLFYGVSDFLGGLKSRSLPLLVVLIVVEVAGLVALTLVAAVAWDGFPATDYVLYAIVAGVLEAAAVAAFYRGLAAGKMSIVAPIAATSPAVAVVAAVILGEHVATLAWFGIALAMAGIALISFGQRDEEGDEALGGSAGGGATIAASVVLGLTAALTFGGYQVAIDAASEGGVPWALVLTRAASVAVIAIAFLAVRPRERPARAEVPVLIGIGLLITVADGAFAVATTLGALGIVAVLGSLYPVATIVLARFYLGERLRPIQQAGVVTCFSGVIAICIA
jgi:drug/metabolite transporter (DMT)-like permease